MTKYIVLLFLIIVFIIDISAVNKYPVNYSRIDSLYLNMTLEEKLSLIVVSLRGDDAEDVNNYPMGINCINLDDLYEFAGVSDPMLSDVMIRSAFLKGENSEEIALVSKILHGNHGEGFFFSMKSPYGLMFQDEVQRASDFFLEPTGRLVVPFVTDSNNYQCFVANAYEIPKQILVSHQIKFNVLSEYSSAREFNYFSSLKWHELQKVLQEYEAPPLEFILGMGGLLYSENYIKDITRLKRIFQKKMLPENILEKSCKKILLCKELIRQSSAVKDFRSESDLVSVFVENVQKKGCVLLENKGVIPISGFTGKKIASLHIGTDGVSDFQKVISKYVSCDHFYRQDIPDKDELLTLKNEIEKYNTVIVGVNGDWYDRDVNHFLYTFLYQISERAELILVHFGSGNKLAHLPDNHPFNAILLAFESGKEMQEIAGQILFGGVPARGVLSKNINGHFPFGVGCFTNKSRLGYVDAYTKTYQDTLRLIDQIAYKAIRERATPGCQVLVAKGGDVIYNKAFGYHTYSKKRKVSTSDLYDIASVTKIVSSVPSVMKMVDEGKMEMSDSLSKFLPRLQDTNKQGVVIGDMLIHQAGLQSWIPFYLRTIDKERLKGDIYSKRYSSQYNIKVDTRLYMNRGVHYRNDVFRHSKSGKFNVEVSDKWYMNYEYVDSIKLGIDTSEVTEDPEYRYSDLGYYYIKDIVESVYHTHLDKFVQDNFYAPLGAVKTLYKPLRGYGKKEIVPTENDKSWRKELLQGFVHDPGAAMLGGVGGHAGVFSSAEDLVKILQMYLNEGVYGGERYLNEETIRKFTSVFKEGNRRGLGFDKPVLEKDISGPSCKEASPESYGHSGFTGTLVWVDPKYDLIYIFLSNRIHPNQYNKRLITSDVRTNIQSVIYHSLPEYWEEKSKSEKDEYPEITIND